METSINRYEAAARSRKVALLTVAARDLGYTADDFDGMGIEGWSALAQLAAVPYPSAETQSQVVVTLLAFSDMPDDPFEGL